MLEHLKDIIQSKLGISPDAIFVLIGLALFLVTCLILRKPLTWGWALIPGLCISILLEAAEIRDQYGVNGLFEKDTKDIAAILLRHSRDILAMNLVPIVVVVVANLWFRSSHD